MGKRAACVFVLLFASGLANAQSHGSMYGLLDYGFMTQRVDGSNRRNALESGIVSGSRIGFRGAEDLGSGVKINYTLEAGFEADTGSSAQGGRLFGRLAWLGVADRWGELRAGRQELVGYSWLGALSPFSTMYGQAGLNTIFGYKSIGDRADNALIYYSPNLKGMEFGASYTRHYNGNESDDNQDDSAVFSGGLRYNQGSLMATLVYERREYAGSLDQEERGNIEHLGVGASYDFNVLKVYALVGQLRGRAFNAKAQKEKSCLIGLSAPIGNKHEVFGTYQHVDGARNFNQHGIKRDRDGLALGYGYTLSKRTDLYAFASFYKDVALRADDNSRLADSNEMGLGIRHRF